MLAVDPHVLACRQVALDRARTQRMPALFLRKLTRMTASPLAFLRGSAPLFYELLAAHPSLAEGPRGKGWIVGDLHLENFGAYRPDHEAHARALFNLNDFDDAIVAPWRLDLLRLTTSLLLAGRELGADGTRALDLAHRMMHSYAEAVFAGAKPPRAPAVVAALIGRAASRPHRVLLDGRTEVVRGHRRFVRGDRYLNLPRAFAKDVQRAVTTYAEGLPAKSRPDAESFEVIDCAWRVAGTGSLGGLRVAALVRGKGGEDGAWILDLKEQGVPSAVALLKKPKIDHAVRVSEAFHACVAKPARWIGTTRIGGLSMFVRRLAPQEDRLDLTKLEGPELDPLASYLGALVGAAHARGATKKPKARWSHEERAQIVDHAIAVAGIHEAAYLALCRLARTIKK